MIRAVYCFLALILALPVLAASPALAQLNAGDPCPETTPGRLFTKEGAGGPALICNGATLEVYESVKTGPMRKGVGTANPEATLDVAGEAKIGNTSLACSATTEGAMRYNSATKGMEYCNGTTWWPFASIAIGTVMSDGTVFAGTYNGSVLYAPPSDQHATAYWGTYGYTTGAVSTTDGPGNQANVYAHVMAGDGTYNPDDGRTPNTFVLCHDLTFGGHSDWYVPAQNELNVLYTNRTAIGGFGAYTYWASAESSNNNAYYMNFSGGAVATVPKTYQYHIRCIRKD